MLVKAKSKSTQVSRQVKLFSPLISSLFFLILHIVFLISILLHFFQAGLTSELEVKFHIYQCHMKLEDYKQAMAVVRFVNQI